MQILWPEVLSFQAMSSLCVRYEQYIRFRYEFEIQVHDFEAHNGYISFLPLISDLPQETEQIKVNGQFEPTSETKYFSFKENIGNGFSTPWKTAFPDGSKRGYWDIFAKHCSTISEDPNGIVDEETARRVWMDILSGYEDYLKMGMWLPERVMDEHLQIATTLGWYGKPSEVK